jgi:hypothetical protein
VTLVSLLDDAEGDVRQKRGEDATLGCADLVADNGSLRKDVGLQERDDESIHFGVENPPANPLHQTVVADVVEACPNIAFDGPWVCEPLVAWIVAVLARLEELTKRFQRAMRASARGSALQDKRRLRTVM